MIFGCLLAYCIMRGLRMSVAACCVGLLGVATSAQSPPQNEMPSGAMLWVYNCGSNVTEWTALIKDLNETAKPAGVTSVSLCAYRIKADGSFGYQTSPYGPANCGQNQEAWAVKIKETGLKQFPLIDCHAGIDAVRNMTATSDTRAAFISAAVATMKNHRYDGFNLDIELSGTPDDAELYTTFVNEFSDALHAAGGSLSSDIDSCGPTHRDYIGMRCTPDYKSSRIDSVMTMGTYTHDLDTFKEQVSSGLAGLGSSKYVVGVDTGSDGDA